MTDTAQFQWTSAFHSHVGLVRKINEDACLDQPDKRIWAVADGMGGHARGDFASLSIVESLSRVPASGNLPEFARAVQDRLQSVNGLGAMPATRRLEMASPRP